VLQDTVTLEYHGESVKLGRMNSYEAAGYIVAFSDLLGVVSRQTCGQRVQLKTEIQGIRQGSFRIEFALTAAGAIATLLTTHTPSPMDLINFLKDSIEAWRHLKGNPPKEIRPAEDNRLQVENQNGQLTYVTADVLNIITDPRAGNAVEQFIKRCAFSLSRAVKSLTSTSAMRLHSCR
jgi:hypothetical protein